MFSKLFKRKEEAADPGVSIFPDGDQVMLSEGTTGEAVVAAPAPTMIAAGANDYMEQLVEGDASGDDLVTLPVLGTAPASKHQKTLLAVVIGGLVVFFALAMWAILPRPLAPSILATLEASRMFLMVLELPIAAPIIPPPPPIASASAPCAT